MVERLRRHADGCEWINGLGSRMADGGFVVYVGRPASGGHKQNIFLVSERRRTVRRRT